MGYSDSKRVEVPLVFIEENVKINTDAYLKMLEEHVRPWGTGSFQNIYLFTQDCATSHTSKSTQQQGRAHLKRFWNKNLRPPFNRDRNPTDLAIWSIPESGVCSAANIITAILKQALATTWSNLSKNTAWCSCLSAVKRVKSVVETKGGHVES